ncbi:MAG: hypothetical protein ACR2O3_07850 [Rhizobiaceae bacterium]
MKHFQILAAGALIFAVEPPAYSHAQGSPGFQPVYTVPIIRLDNNGYNLSAGSRAFDRYRSSRHRKVENRRKFLKRKSKKF